MELQLVGLDGSEISRGVWGGDALVSALFKAAQRPGCDCRLFQGARELWPWDALRSLEAEPPVQVVRTPPLRSRESRSGGFAALREDGSWVVWGSSRAPEWGLACDFLEAVRGLGESAAVNSDGRVVTWDVRDCPEGALHLQLDLRRVYSNERAFAAVSADQRVALWGYKEPELLGGHVVSFLGNACGAAALMRDGSVVTCGSGPASRRAREAPRALLRSGVAHLEANSMAFAALKDDGSVVTWGVGLFGGFRHRQLARVVLVKSSDAAFAALKADGSVEAWGDGEAGGDASAVAAELSSGVLEIVATRPGFAALKADGSVVAWGGGDPAQVRARECSALCGTYLGAFAALRRDGSVVTWGRADAGGDASAVAAQLLGGVVNVRSNHGAFAALKSDGRVVTWGDAAAGGDSSRVGSGLVDVAALFS